MSTFRSTRFTNDDPNESTTIAGISTFTSTAYLIPPTGSERDKPSGKIAPGTIRYNNEIGRLEVWTGDQWEIIVGTTPDLSGGTRGVYTLGYAAPLNLNVINWIIISTTGNAADFGDLLTSTRQRSACASSTRGLIAGGYTGPAFINVIEYITISSTGNSQDFGDLTQTRGIVNGGSCSSSTRGLFAGGYFDAPVATRYNIIDYVTIASTGNAVDFGDLLTAVDVVNGCSSSTRGIFAGGRPLPTLSNVIQYVTISTTGNTTDFGDLSGARISMASAANATRGVFAGGYAPGVVNIIEYITIATTGNATDFGDLPAARSSAGGAASSTRGVFAGGYTASPFPSVNTMEYITILSTGNALDFGDLTQAAQQVGGMSNGHGGL